MSIKEEVQGWVGLLKYPPEFRRDAVAYGPRRGPGDRLSAVRSA